MFIYFLKDLCVFILYIKCFAYMYVCIPYVCLVTTKAREGIRPPEIRITVVGPEDITQLFGTADSALNH